MWNCAITLVAPPPRETVRRIRTLALAAITFAQSRNPLRAQSYFEQVMNLLPDLPAHQAPMGRTISEHYKQFLGQTGHKRKVKAVDRRIKAIFGPNPPTTRLT